MPGSVLPVVMQMEAGRSRGACRRTILAANLITVLLSVCVGLVFAGLLLPFSVPEALHRFWWALASLPLLLVLAHPRSIPFLLDRLLKALRRKPLEVQMTGSASMIAAGWSALTWVALGTHLAVLPQSAGPTPGRVAAGVIASRVILLLADLLMAGLVTLTSPRWSKAIT
jgi:hypothetical protein